MAMHRMLPRLIVACGPWIAIVATIYASAQEPNYFRRDHGRAAADDQPLPAELTDEHLVWKTELQEGHSTPLIVGERIYLTTRDGNDLSTVCLDRASGDVLWKQTVQADELERLHPEGSAASCTCANDGQRVYSFFGSYGLVAYTLDGDPVWTHRMGPFRDEFGSSSSPILVDGKLILCEDHDLDSFLIAIAAKSGKTVWKTPRDGFTRSYATPVVWKLDGRDQIVMAGALQLVAYDPSDGSPLWSRDGFARIVNPTPAAVDGALYVCTWSPGGDTDARIAMEPWSQAIAMWDKDGDGEIGKSEVPAGPVQTRFYRIDLNDSQSLDEAEWNKYARIFELAQNVLVALRPDEPGGQPEVVWEYRRGLSYVPSPLVYRGHVFLAKDGGIVTLLDAATGELVKQMRARGGGNCYASPAGGDNKIYTASKGGVVTVFALDDPLAIVSSRDFGERIFASPVLHDGWVYIRTDKALYAFGNK